MSAVLRDAHTVVMASFGGPRVPGWTRAAIEAGLGAVCLFGSNLTGEDGELRALTDELHAAGAGDVGGGVLVAIDEEGGDVTRLDAVRGSELPSPAAIGRVDDVALTRTVATGLARRLRAVGVDLDLAPVADVDADPRNPVIGVRSFGADPQLVARHVAVMVAELQRGGVAACVKHFPGHGATAQDSHLTLPEVDADPALLARRELPPFRAAVSAGAEAVMSGHLLVPALDPSGPASTSAAVTAVLRRDLGFAGVLVTDALDMDGVSGPRGHGSLPAAAVAALQAGADLLCLGSEGTAEGLDTVVTGIVAAVASGTVPRERLAEAAARVRALAGRAAGRRATVGAAGPEDPTVVAALAASVAAGAEVSRRAVRVDGTLPAIAGALVVRLTATPNIAVGAVPWGLAPVAGDRLASAGQLYAGHLDAGPGADAAEVLRQAAGRPLVAVVRDAARTPWALDLLTALAAGRPELVVVELGHGGPDRLPGAVVVRTGGAGRGAARAAADVLAGAR